MSILRTILMAVAALGALLSSAGAQSYPERVVKFINPYPPGGSVDITGRLLAQKLTEMTKHQFIVENRAGAGGNTGADAVAKSAPDGYTLLFTAPPPLVVNQTLYAKGLPFDPEKDFAPIAIFARTPIVLMVHPSVAANNVRELVELAKREPGKIHFGSAGIGTTPHLSGELFKALANVQMTHVPYRGTGPAMNDLIAGHIQMMFDLLPGSLPQIAAGKVRALANAGATRAAALKDLPTVAEQGVPGFDSASWVALVAPAKTPAPVLAWLRAEAGKAIAAPDIVKRLSDLGSEPGTADEKQMRAFLAAETKKWAEVIRTSGAKVE
jgi:tripartite-type tricarboxylate transporter receptor subunit TctC